MLVRYKPTGQLGEIPDDKFDPTLFEAASAPQESATPLPPMPQQNRGILESIGSGVIDIGKSIAKPFVRTAENVRDASILPAQVLASKAVETVNPQLAAQIASADVLGSQSHADTLTEDVQDKSMLDRITQSQGANQQLKDSINVASYAVPFGKGANVATKALAPGAAAGVMQGLSQDEVTPEGVIGSGVVGAGGAGVIHAASTLLPKIFGGASKAAGAISEDLATKSIRPSKTQLLNFSKQHGEALPDVIKRYNLVGNSVEEIETRAIDPLQSSFDDIARNSQLPADIELLRANTAKTLEPLMGKGSTLEDQKIAASILEEMKNIDEVLSAGGTIEDLSAYRKSFDDKVRNWKLDPVQAGKNRVAGNIVRDTIQGMADNAGLVGPNGQSLKELGIELSKLYGVRDLVELQSGLGKGNLPMGLLKVLGAGFGGSVGGIPGAAAGMAAESVINHPKTIAAGSNFASKIASTLTGLPKLPAGVTNVAEKAAAIALPNVLSSGDVPGGQSPNNDNTNNSQNHIDASIPNQAVDVNYLTGHSPEELYRAYQAAQGDGNKRAASELRQMYEDEVAYQKRVAGSNKPKSSAALQVLGKSQAGLSALDEIERQLAQNPAILAQSSIPGAPGARVYESMVSSITDAIGGLRTGASVSPQQQAFYRNLLPKFGDSPETIRVKIDALRRELNTYAQGLGAIEDTPLPAMP